MEFQYSEYIAPTFYETDGLCDGIPLRRHKDPMGEVKGAIRCQKMWSKLIEPVRNYKGTLGDPFSFVRVTIPESLSERLEIISFANEFAFLYDDTFMEDLDQQLQSENRHQILNDFGSGDLPRMNSMDGNDHTALKAQGAKQIQSRILEEMMAIDKGRALTTMKSWQKFIKVVASRQRSEPFASLEEYLPYRISDAGELFWFGLMTFAMALTIPEEEMDLCKRLGRPAWSVLALTNDLYSWDKERDAAAKVGAPHVVNAIWVLMREHSITETQAKDLCRHKVKEHVVEAIQVVEATRSNVQLSLDLRKYTEAILYTISGNLVWSIYCPRYHPELSYGRDVRTLMAEVGEGAPEVVTGIGEYERGQSLCEA
ncbi:MAG: hypothetical protein Q9222_005300 [Ikaeria aurantiellina]